MVRRLSILCFLVALWPGLALAQSPEFDEAAKQVKTLYAQGRYSEAEPFARRALELAEREFGACTRPRAVTPGPSRSTSGP